MQLVLGYIGMFNAILLSPVLLALVRCTSSLFFGIFNLDTTVFDGSGQSDPPDRCSVWVHRS